MPLLPMRVVTACISVLMLILPWKIIPPYWSQGLFQLSLLLILGAILLEAASKRRFVVMDPIYVFVVSGFVLSGAISFFMSDMHKAEISSGTLTRCLWATPIWAAFLVCVHDKFCERVLLASAGISLLILIGNAYPFAGAGESPGRLGVSIIAGGLAALAGWKFVLPDESTPLKKKLVITAVCMAIFLAVWTTASKVRLDVDETELLRKNGQVEKMVLGVSEICLKDQPLIGTGGGAMKIKFLQLRPTDATLLGIPDRLTVPSQSMAILVAETGLIGLLLFLALVSFPATAAISGHPDAGRALLFGLYGTFIAHEIMGGGWIETHGGALIFFSVIGIMLARQTRREEKMAPTSVFLTGIVIVAGLILLQQIYWWKTVQAEMAVKQVRELLKNKKLNEAADIVDRILFFVDPRRNDILSLMVGGYNDAGLPDKALANSLLLLQRDPDYPSVKNNIGAFYVMMGKYNDAVPYIKETAERHPTTENLAKLGHLYLTVGQKQAAIQAFLESLSIFQREAGILMARQGNRGEIQMQAKIALEAAAFSIKNVLQFLDEKTHAEMRTRILTVYQSSSAKLKSDEKESASDGMSP